MHPCPRTLNGGRIKEIKIEEKGPFGTKYLSSFYLFILQLLPCCLAPYGSQGGLVHIKDKATISIHY